MASRALRLARGALHAAGLGGDSALAPVCTGLAHRFAAAWAPRDPALPSLLMRGSFAPGSGIGSGARGLASEAGSRPAVADAASSAGAGDAALYSEGVGGDVSEEDFQETYANAHVSGARAHGGGALGQ